MVKFSPKSKLKQWIRWRSPRADQPPKVIEVTAERITEEPPQRAVWQKIFTRWQQGQPPADVSSNDLEEQVEEQLEGQDKTRIAAVFHQFMQRVRPEDIELIRQRLGTMHRGQVKAVWAKVQSLAQMIKDPNVAWKSKAVAIAALLYLISPLDAIPDVIPFAGLADDVAVIIAVVSTLAIELEKYVTRQAEKQAEIEIKKHTQIVRITLLGSIAAAAIAIVVKLILNALS